MKNKVKAPFVGKKSRKFPKGLQVRFTHNKYVPKNMHMVLIIDIFRLECTQIPVDQTLGWIPRTDIHREFAAVKESWQIALEIEIKYYQQCQLFKQETVT